MIESIEAPQFLGADKGTDNQDVLTDLQEWGSKKPRRSPEESGAYSIKKQHEARKWVLKVPPFKAWARLVLCLEDIDPTRRAYARQTEPECTYGNLGSAINFWKISQRADRITMGFKMPTNAAFNSMPNKDVVVVGGKNQPRGYHDGSRRVYTLELGLSTTEISAAVTLVDYLLSTLRPALPTEVRRSE